MTFEPGYKIGAYIVVRLLGQGGMGAVYEVEHAELGTHYALKTFVYDTADEYADLLLTAIGLTCQRRWSRANICALAVIQRRTNQIGSI